MILSEDIPSSSLSQAASNAVEIAKQVRSQAASARLKKPTQVPDFRNINTTAGLNYAKNSSSNQPGSDKIKIAIEVRIKGTSKRSNAGDSYGKWIKSWAKDVYLTGKHWFSCLSTSRDTQVPSQKS